jgi:hypothetical protein
MNKARAVPLVRDGPCGDISFYFFFSIVEMPNGI